MSQILEKLCKWRGVFAGWQLGTRTTQDAESNAVRDHREVTILLRAEVNALTAMLIEKKVFTAEEFQTQLDVEAHFLDEAYEGKFPGFKTDDMGVVLDVKVAHETMKRMNWRP